MYKEILSNSKYYTIKELKYSNKLEKNLDDSDVKEFIKLKLELSNKLNLKNFDNEIYYYNHESLNIKLKEFISFNRKYYKDNEISIIEKRFPDIMISRILSEIEGTLLIENIPTTRKRIQEVIKSKITKTADDVIIRNMDNGIKFILTKPKFNKENLFKLYSLISEDSLSTDVSLKDNDYYRYDDVYIDGYTGCDVSSIEECMDSLFDFIKSNLNTKSNLKYLLPHIAHYYILYIHPYFDFNGRCARLVSLWISTLTNLYDHPLYISEAINDNKKEYYQAIVNTRDMGNDLTYFLNYIFDISNNFCLIYENVDYIEECLSYEGIVLNVLEKTYLKRILSKIKTPYFNHKIFLEYVNLDITKQGALKILNKFEDCNILNSMINNKNQKMFYLNKTFLKY